MAIDKAVNVVMRRAFQASVGRSLPLGSGLAAAKKKEVSLIEDISNGRRTNCGSVRYAGLGRNTGCVQQRISGPPERRRDAGTCRPIPVRQRKVVIAGELP